MGRNLNKTLHYLYNTPGLNTFQGSLHNLFKAAKAYFSKLKKSHVERWLFSQDSYTLHKLPRRINQPKVEVTSIDEQWCADLCDMSNIANFNDNKTFLLTVIDVFSKKADAEEW